MTKSTVSVSITTALQAIAEQLTDIVTKTTESGDKEKVNRMAYTQGKVLNGIAYSIANQLQFTVTQVDKARADVKAAMRSHRGDEISEQALNRKLDWLDTMELQEATLTQLLASATKVYTHYTGKEFAPPVPSKAPAKVFTTAAVERAAAKLGVTGNEVRQSDGVDTAA